MAAVTAQGTTLTIDSQLMGDVLSIGAPTLTVTTIDSSDLDSTTRTFIGGLKDGGELTFELAYNPSGTDHQALITDIDGTEKACVVTWSDTKTTSFNAIVTAFSSSAAMDDKITASVTMKISGAVTFPS